MKLIVTSRPSLVFACILVGLGLAACKENVNKPSVNSATTTTDAGAQGTHREAGPVTTLEPGSVQSTGSRTVSPLSSAFVTLEEADVEEWDEAVVQEYVAVCMREEGFEYVPYVEEPNDDTSDWERSIFSVAASSEASRVESVDPNQEYLESLSESERRAYSAALTGQDPDVVVEEGSPEGDSDIEATGGSGCDGQARRQYAAELEADSQKESEDPNAVLFTRLDEAVNQMLGELEADETVGDALTEYSGCLADAGFLVEYPSSAYDTVYWMPQELYWYLAGQGADLLDGLSSNPAADPIDLVGAERVDELAQLEADAREAHTACVPPLEEAVREFKIDYARSDPTLNQYLSED